MYQLLKYCHATTTNTKKEKKRNEARETFQNVMQFMYRYSVYYTQPLTFFIFIFNAINMCNKAIKYPVTLFF